MLRRGWTVAGLESRGRGALLLGDGLGNIGTTVSLVWQACGRTDAAGMKCWSSACWPRDRVMSKLDDLACRRRVQAERGRVQAGQWLMSKLDDTACPSWTKWRVQAGRGVRWLMSKLDDMACPSWTIWRVQAGRYGVSKLDGACPSWTIWRVQAGRYGVSKLDEACPSWTIWA
jgi:hypothetical protein